MEEFVMRELTKSEFDKLDSFIADENTELYQYFMAIVISDLIPVGKLSLEKALEKVLDDYPKCDPKEDPFSVYGLIDAWLRLCMEYKNYGLVDLLDRRQVRGLRYSIDVIINGFINCIWYDVSIGSAGKKQSDLEENYTRIVMQGVPKWTGVQVDVDPKLMYCFIMTTLENIGFRLIVQSDNTRCIDLEIFRGIEF